MDISAAIHRAVPAIFLLACVGDPAPTGPVGGADSGADTSVPADASTADAATDSGVVPDTSVPWDPSQIAGLVLWLDADSVVANVNGHVDAWSDKSPSKNDAKAANEAQKATLLTGGVGINGHQALRFDGTTSFYTIADSASLQWSQSFVIEAVFRHPPASAAELGAIYNKQTATALNNPMGPSLNVGASMAYPGYPTFVDFQLAPNSDITSDASDGGLPPGAHRVRAAWDAATNTLSIQADTQPTVQAVKAITGYGAAGHDAKIGVDPNGFYLKSDLAEVVAIAGNTVAPGDVVKLQTYLDKKYGL
jgi:hypothetical protein